jgi:COPII coat assembly protein SEC16
VDKLQELSDRMSADGKNDSTLLKKVAKPNLDSIGSWFEGRLTKFIAGEEGSEADPITGKAIAGDSTKQANSAVGPFSHYSTITSGVHGNQMARAASSYDLSGANGLGARMPPSNRTVSAMSHRSPDMEISQYRPSSAHSQRSNTFSGVNFTGIPPPSQPAEERPVFAPRRPSSTASGYGDQIESSLAPVVAMPSWGQSYDFDEATDLGTPTGDAADASNFINPMMAYNTTVAASSTQQVSQSSYRPASRQDEEEETVDDLGLGNSARRASPPKPESGDNNENVKTSKPADSAKPTPSGKRAFVHPRKNHFYSNLAFCL